MRVIGVDPGSRVTGWGVIDCDSRGEPTHVAHGCLRLGDGALAERLGGILAGLGECIDHWAPAVMALETAFVSRNAATALKLGQARGAAICAGVQRALTVSEYAPRAVKLAVVGYGNAGKPQIQHMVRMLLRLAEAPASDAADALAVAICHGHSEATRARLAAAGAEGGSRVGLGRGVGR